MNYQRQLDHHISSSWQIVERFTAGDYAAQIVPPTGSWNNHREPIKLVDHEISAVPEQLEDLRAVVQKCNVKGFQNAFYTQDRRINGGEEEEEESLKRKRSVTSSSFRENRIVSERQKRIEMNELFAQMRSLLPENPTAKSDKASIITGTIKYIQSLKRGLATLSKKPATTILSNTIKSKAMNLVPNADQTACDKSMCSKYWEWDQNLTVKYDGKYIFITINTMNKANLLPSIILAVESRDIEVMDAFVSVTERLTFVSLQLKAAKILDTVARESLSGILSKLIKL